MTAAIRLHRWLWAGRGFLLLLALLLVLRLVQALNSTHSFDYEDGYTLAAAFERLHHDVWPYPVYQISDWENGSRLLVWLAVPLCALLGPSLLVLKLVALLFTCVTFCALYLLVRETYGRRPALLACLLYLFFPGPVFHYSLTAHGFHPDSVAFQLLFLWRLVLLLKGRYRPRELLLCGLLGGFAVWFAYISALTVIAGTAVLLSHLWRRRHSAPAALSLQLLAYVAGGMVFVVLLLAYNLDNQMAGLYVYARTPITSYISLSGLGHKLAHFWGDSLPLFFTFSKPLNRSDMLSSLFGVLYWVAAVGALAWPYLGRLAAARRLPGALALAPPRSSLDAVLWLLVGLTLFVFLASGHDLWAYHLIPLLVLLLGPISARLVRLRRLGRLPGQLVATGFVGLLLALGIPLNLQELRLHSAGLGRHVDGRNYQVLYRRITELPSPAPLVSNIQRWMELPLELSYATMWHLDYPVGDYGYELADPLFRADAPRGITRLLDDPRWARSPSKPRILAGYLLARAYIKQRMTREAIFLLVDSRAAEEQPLLLEGLGFGLEMHHYPEFLAATQNNQLRQRRLAFGMGRSVPVSVLFDYRGYGCASFLPPGLRASYVEGLGYGLSCRLVKQVPASVRRRICAALRSFFDRGVARSGLRCKRIFDLHR